MSCHLSKSRIYEAVHKYQPSGAGHIVVLYANEGNEIGTLIACT
jgi:hypothetical protein